jgi:hypothetical protein
VGGKLAALGVRMDGRAQLVLFTSRSSTPATLRIRS